MKKIIIGLILCMLFYYSGAYAWDSTGHRVIAQIAYDNLTPKAKKRIDKLTQKLDRKYPAPSRFLFASTWADQIKNDNVTAFNDWHFINYPFSTDGAHLLQPATENVIWAINQSDQVLLSTKSNVNEKALFLRFLVHFVADAHQPLHCVELFSHEFPRGDKSGNLFLIQDAYAHNLHAYWDQGVGLFRQYGSHYPLSNKKTRKLASKIEQDYPLAYFADSVKDLNPADWAQQSFQIATKFTYNVKENTSPKSDYRKKGQVIAEQQIALAGYRLANLLNQIFATTVPTRKSFT